MLQFVTGNIFEQDTVGLVNPVNCRGAMGKGLALQFKIRWPDMFNVYRENCRKGIHRPGQVVPWMADRTIRPIIFLFPTKDDWRKPSRLDYIQTGLDDLLQEIRSVHVDSISMPRLGCGEGGLDWKDVRPLIEDFAAGLPDVDIRVVSLRGE